MWPRDGMTPVSTLCTKSCVTTKEHSVNYVYAYDLVVIGHFLEFNNFDSRMVYFLNSKLRPSFWFERIYDTIITIFLDERKCFVNHQKYPRRSTIYTIHAVANSTTSSSVFRQLVKHVVLSWCGDLLPSLTLSKILATTKGQSLVVE